MLYYTKTRLASLSLRSSQVPSISDGMNLFLSPPFFAEFHLSFVIFRPLTRSRPWKKTKHY